MGNGRVVDTIVTDGGRDDGRGVQLARAGMLWDRRPQHIPWKGVALLRTLRRLRFPATPHCSDGCEQARFAAVVDVERQTLCRNRGGLQNSILRGGRRGGGVWL